MHHLRGNVCVAVMTPTTREALGVQERFWSRVDIRGPDECWPWTGSYPGVGGYGGFSFYAQDDRSRYSILSYKMWLGVTLDYSTTYYWFVRKDFDDEITDSDVWSFTTIDYQPPALRTRQKIPYGGGAPITVPTGENNMMSVNRLIVAGDNSIFYEDV